MTRAVLDVPSGADERIFAVLGPGRASDVLASLLNDAHFNYAILGSDSDPSALARVNAVGSSAKSPQVAQQAGAGGTDTPAAPARTKA